MGILRLLFALSVLISHSYPIFGNNLLGRDAAVRGFFVISGFYMSLILNEKYVNKNGSFKLFITNRFLRIYPIYWFTLILSLISFYFFIPSALNLYSLSLNGISNLLRDITVLFRFDYLTINPNFNEAMLISQAWTLVLEILFYLVAPFIVKRSTKFISLLILISVFIRFIVFVILRLNGDPTTDRFFPAEIVFFLLGAISYKIYKNFKQKNIPTKNLLAVLISTITITIFYNAFSFTLQYHWLDFKSWGYLGLLTISIPFIFKLTNKLKIDQMIGDLSYPVYLIHVLVITMLVNVVHYKTSQNLFVLSIIIITLIISEVMVITLEKPIDILRQRRLKK